MTSNKLYVVLVTTSTPKQAEEIAEHLVRQQLAACVNIIGPIRSVYVWEGNLQKEEEYLLFIKAAAQNFADLESAVREKHSYAVPEVIALEVVEGSQPYLEWVLSATPMRRVPEK
ncbi:Divalent-cation tolerance protein CutA [bacterium HR30]|nr:Divalent-cation tolerance protein CutA [bacterium HR30]